MKVRIVRAGLFLLFSVLVAVVSPLQPTLASDLTMRNPAEVKSEVKETRDTGKLRQRAASEDGTRRERRTPDRGAPLPNGLQAGPGWRQDPFITALRGRTKPHEDAARNRHAPATLQVYRH